MTSKEFTEAKKFGFAQKIDGEYITVGTRVTVYDWLAFGYVIVGMPRANKLILMDAGAYDSKKGGYSNTVTITRCRKGANCWKMGGHKVSLDLHPKAGSAEAHNKAIESSETWMCM